jgi:hypothetical protein
MPDGAWFNNPFHPFIKWSLRVDWAEPNTDSVDLETIIHLPATSLDNRRILELDYPAASFWFTKMLGYGSPYRVL